MGFFSRSKKIRKCKYCEEQIEEGFKCEKCKKVEEYSRLDCGELSEDACSVWDLIYYEQITAKEFVVMRDKILIKIKEASPLERMKRKYLHKNKLKC